jgi:hypothetical protein
MTSWGGQSHVENGPLARDEASAVAYLLVERTLVNALHSQAPGINNTQHPAYVTPDVYSDSSCLPHHLIIPEYDVARFTASPQPAAHSRRPALASVSVARAAEAVQQSRPCRRKTNTTGHQGAGHGRGATARRFVGGALKHAAPQIAPG